MAAVGIEFFSTIFGLFIAGYLLDQHFHTEPALGVAGILIGMVVGIFRLITGLRQLDTKS